MAVAVGAPQAPHRRRDRRRWGPALVFVGPFVVLFLVFFVLPIGYAVYDSLFSVQSSGLGLGPAERLFVGFDNYARALAMPDFVQSLGRVLAFSAIEVPLMVVCAVVLALALESAYAWKPVFFRVTFFLPYGVPGVIASLLWGFLYVPSTSPVIKALSSWGWDVDVLTSDTILFSIANIALWQFAGYNMLILVASLQAISHELYEAARVDGAGELTIAWRIKLPLLRPSVVLITVFTIIGTLQLFAEPLVLKPFTTAINSNFTPNLAAYNQAFAQGNRNLAAAMAVIVALMAFAASFAFLRIVNSGGKKAW